MFRYSLQQLNKRYTWTMLLTFSKLISKPCSGITATLDGQLVDKGDVSELLPSSFILDYLMVSSIHTMLVCSLCLYWLCYLFPLWLCYYWWWVDQLWDCCCCVLLIAVVKIRFGVFFLKWLKITWQLKWSRVKHLREFESHLIISYIFRTI